ncbi:MAG TPA: ATP-binding cassette domain-containing protein [Gammaproteobacteria bacterium]|nr:ATP-binding cassette domain-containing protein [Gammaproteobacteria bacterium]
MEHVIEVHGLETRFGNNIVHDNLDFTAQRGEIIGIVGGSGSGKSVLMWTILGLRRPNAGQVKILGFEVDHQNPSTAEAIQARTGVLFQDGALFSSLTVLQNIMVPLQRHTRISGELVEAIAGLKLAMVGLDSTAAYKMPGELSGGMRKRVSLARALSLDPEILFLDEPTAGLDPIGAAAFDSLILDLQRALGLTVIMITHDLDSLFAITDRISVLIHKRLVTGTISELLEHNEPWINEYFNGPRGRAVTKLS